MWISCLLVQVVIILFVVLVRWVISFFVLVSCVDMKLKRLLGVMVSGQLLIFVVLSLIMVITVLRLSFVAV